jgi:hypothetical protein
VSGTRDEINFTAPQSGVGAIDRKDELNLYFCYSLVL